MSPSWATVRGQRHSSQLQQSTCAFREKWRSMHCRSNSSMKAKNPPNSKVTNDESMHACGRYTCCSVLWWISGCQHGIPTGKHNYNCLIFSILRAPLRPREAQRWSGFITCLLPQDSTSPSLCLCLIKDNDCWDSIIIRVSKCCHYIHQKQLTKE